MDHRKYLSPQIMSHHKLEKDDYNRFFYTPRTISTLGILLLLCNAMAFGGHDWLKEATREYFAPDDDRPDPFENTRFAIFFGFFTLLGFALTQFPDSYVRRPHPVVWRIFLGAELGYAMFMTMILVLPKHEAR